MKLVMFKQQPSSLKAFAIAALLLSSSGTMINFSTATAAPTVAKPTAKPAAKPAAAPAVQPTAPVATPVAAPVTQPTITAETLIQQGDAKAAKDDHKGAIVDYTEALKLQSDSIPAYTARGKAHEKLGNSKDAIADYSQIIKLKPELADGYMLRGTLHQKLKDKKSATSDAQKAAELYKKQKNADGSQKAQDLLTLINTKTAGEYFVDANMKIFGGNAKGAIADLTKAIELAEKAGEDASAYRNLLNTLVDQMTRPRK